MRISDCSADVCSSDLDFGGKSNTRNPVIPASAVPMSSITVDRFPAITPPRTSGARWPPSQRRQGLGAPAGDRQTVASGKSVASRVDLGGRRIIKTIQYREDLSTRRHEQTIESQ